MMKKRMYALSAGLLAVIMLLGLWVRAEKVFAVQEGTTGKDYVIDDADIFSDEEEQKLQKKCEQASKSCKTDIAVITLKTGLDYAPLDEYVRTIIDEKYGYNGDENPRDAIVYVIDMKSRADRIITSGNTRYENITQSQLDGIREGAEKKLTKGHYYSGCVKYIDGVQRYMNPNIWYRLTLKLPLKLGISAAVAVVAVLLMMYHAKTKITVNSRTYSGNKVDIRRQEDRFINTTVTTRHISSNSGGSGGGGSSGGGNSGSSGGHF